MPPVAPIDPVEDPYQAPLEVSAITGHALGTLAQLRHKGGGPEFVKLRGKVRYRRSAVLAWLKEQEDASREQQEARRKQQEAASRNSAA